MKKFHRRTIGSVFASGVTGKELWLNFVSVIKHVCPYRDQRMLRGVRCAISLLQRESAPHYNTIVGMTWDV
jgi:hypothetical protein